VSPERAWVKENADESTLKCLRALKKNNLEGHYFSSGAKALNHILRSIPPWVSVGFGDSETVEQIGLKQWSRSGFQEPCMTEGRS